MVDYLTFSASQTAAQSGWLAPTSVATAVVLIGTAASFLGSEVALRTARHLLVKIAIVGSGLTAILTGSFGLHTYGITAALAIIYGSLIYLDSAVLTAGTSAAAVPSRRGITLAVHSTLGYVGGVIGPLLVGLVLDRAGGMSAASWGLAFTLLSTIDAAGLWLYWTLSKPRAWGSP